MTQCKRCQRRRPYYSRGLCRPCYTVLQREHRLEEYPAERQMRYGQELIEELDFQGMTWVRLEREFGRTRKEMAAVLRYWKREDLIERTDLLTDGVSRMTERRSS